MPLRDRVRIPLLLLATLAASTPALGQVGSPPASSGPPEAQLSPDSAVSSTALGLSLESLVFPGEDEGGIALVALHISSVRPPVGPDVSFAVSPRWLLAGCPAGIVDAGPGMSFPGKQGVVLVRAGGSAIGATCGRPSIAAYAGAAVLLRAGRYLAVRLDATPRLAFSGELTPFISFGIGLSQLPSSMRPEMSPR